MTEYLERKAAVMRLMQDGCSAKNVQSIMGIPAVDVEKISDGYHTFADLYEQRLILSAALAKNNPYAWKSKRHEDGSVPFGGGWFIMGFDTDEGCYTYHYELKDWDLFQCKELDKGKPRDGHTSKDVRRLLSIPAAVSVPQWISVKDRLPKPTEQWPHCIVLVNVAHWPTSTYDICDSPYDEEFVVTAIYNSKQKIWHINGWDEQINALLPIIDDEPVNGSCVTHWMPLPEPPKGENDG